MTGPAERIAYTPDPELSFWPTPPEVAVLFPGQLGMEECERGAFGAVGAAVSTALIWAEKHLGRETE